MCLEQVEKQRNFQDRTKHWGAFTGLTTCSLLEWKLINANSPPCADVLVIKFGVYYGHSEIGIYFLRSLKVAMDSWFEFDCQSSNFFSHHISVFIPQRKYHGCTKNEISLACCKSWHQHRLQLRNKEMGLERQLRCILLIFKLSFSLESCLDWLTLF